LATHTTYRVALRHRAVELSRLRLCLFRGDGGDQVFRLRLRGRERSSGGIVYLVVSGRLVANEAGTDILLSARSGRPISAWDWLLQLLWYGLLMAAVAVAIAVAWVERDPRLWQAAGGLVVFVALLYLLLALVHRRAVRAVLTLLARAVAAPLPGERARITVLR
jgi:hypothetical protein